MTLNLVDAAKMAKEKPKKKWMKVNMKGDEKPKKKTFADKAKSMYGKKEK